MTAANTLSRALRALLVVGTLLLGGCALLQADQQMKRLDAAVYFTGIVETERPARGPIVVVLYTLDGPPVPVFLDVVPRSRGVYHLAAPPGRYGILAFEDVDRNMRYQAGEPATLYQGTALGIGAVNDPPSESTGLGHVRIPATAPPKLLPAVFDEAYQALVRRRNEEFGAQAAIDEGRFAPEQVRAGLFQPLGFMAEGRSGLFMLEPFDPKRIPVIFVHGIGGSPRDWAYVIDKMDRTRFQPWVFFYPSGVSIGLSALLLNNAIDELHDRHAFDTSIVVAHSMGGLVVRGALNIILREGRTPPVHHVLTISTPWLGHAAARWADVGPTRVPGSWLDMAPNSRFLSDLMVAPRPDDIRYTLLFGYGGRSRFVSGNNDGTVSLQSMLPPGIQSRADHVFGFDEDHSSILQSDVMVDKLMQRMREEADRRFSAPRPLE